MKERGSATASLTQINAGGEQGGNLASSPVCLEVSSYNRAIDGANDENEGGGTEAEQTTSSEQISYTEPVEVYVRLVRSSAASPEEEIKYVITSKTFDEETGQTVEEQSNNFIPNNLILLGTDCEDLADNLEPYEGVFATVFDKDVTDEAINASLIPRVIEQLRSDFDVCLVHCGSAGNFTTTPSLSVSSSLLADVLEVFFTSMQHEDCALPFSTIIEISGIAVVCSTGKAYNLLSDESEVGKELRARNSRLNGDHFFFVQTLKEALVCLEEASHRLQNIAHRKDSHGVYSIVKVKVCKYLDGHAVQSPIFTIIGSEQSIHPADEEAAELQTSVHYCLGNDQTDCVSEDDVDHDGLCIESVLTPFVREPLRNSHVILLCGIAIDRQAAKFARSMLDFADSATSLYTVKRRPNPVRYITDAGGLSQADTQLQNEVELLRATINRTKEELAAERLRQSCIAATALDDKEVAQVTADINEHIGLLEDNIFLCEMLIKERETNIHDERVNIEVSNRLEYELSARAKETRRIIDILKQSCERKFKSLISEKDIPAILSLVEDFCLRILFFENERKVARDLLNRMSSRCAAIQCSAVFFEKSTAETQLELISTQQELEHVQEMNNVMKSRIEQLEMTLFKERNDRIGREDVIAMSRAAAVSFGELEAMRKTVEEQKMTIESTQARLSGAEQELGISEKQRVKATDELTRMKATFSRIWALLTPTQKLHLGNTKGGVKEIPAGNEEQDPLTSRSVANRHQQQAEVAVSTITPGIQPSAITQAAELLNLRSQVRLLNREIKLQNSDLKDKKELISALQRDFLLTQETLDIRNREYQQLAALEVDQSEKVELLEQQIESLYSEIDAHDARYRTAEQQFKSAQSQWERAQLEDHRAVKRTEELGRELEKERQYGKMQQRENENLSSKLKEMNNEKNTMLKTQELMKARITKLEKSLADERQKINAISTKQRLSNAGKMGSISTTRSVANSGNLSKIVLEKSLRPHTLLDAMGQAESNAGKRFTGASSNVSSDMGSSLPLQTTASRPLSSCTVEPLSFSESIEHVPPGFSEPSSSRVATSKISRKTTEKVLGTKATSNLSLNTKGNKGYLGVRLNQNSAATKLDASARRKSI